MPRARDLDGARVRLRLLAPRACSSGWQPPEHAGDEFSGLNRALLRAGAPAAFRARAAPRAGLTANEDAHNH